MTKTKIDEIDDYEVRKLSYCLTRFRQWLDSVVIIHRRDYYDYYVIFWAGGGGCFNHLYICLCWWIDKGISPKCFLLNSKTTFNFTREWEVKTYPLQEISAFKRIQFIVPAKYSLELKRRFIICSTQLGFTENTDKKKSKSTTSE